MKESFKKLIVFALIISFFSTAYATFLGTVMKQGFLTDHFLRNWLTLIPKTYLFIFPFVLIMGSVVRAWVDKMFNREKNKIKKQ